MPDRANSKSGRIILAILPRRVPRLPCHMCLGAHPGSRREERTALHTVNKQEAEGDPGSGYKKYIPESLFSVTYLLQLVSIFQGFQNLPK